MPVNPGRNRFLIDGAVAPSSASSTTSQSQNLTQTTQASNESETTTYYPYYDYYYTDWHQLAVKAGKAQKPKPKPNTLVESVAEEHGAKPVNVNIQVGGSTRVPEDMIKQRSEAKKEEEQYEGPVLRAYNPSTTEKIETWWEEHKNKIPLVSFFSEFYERLNEGEKEAVMSAASKGKPYEALGPALLAGALKGSVLLPITLGEAALDFGRALTKAAESQDTIQSWTGLTHENPLSRKPEVEVLPSYEEVWRDRLALARNAPQVLEAQEKLNKAEELEPQFEQLEREAQELLKQKQYLDKLENQITSKAKTNPLEAFALSKLYNAEAAVFNEQVNAYNAKVAQLKEKYHGLQVEKAEETLKKYNENLKKASIYNAIGEFAGAFVGSAGFIDAFNTWEYYLGPERTITRNVVIKEPKGTRVVTKSTTYKGVIHKRPIRTEQLSILVKSEHLPDGMPLSFSDDIAKSAVSLDEPFTIRAVKASEESGHITFRINDARLFEYNKEFLRGEWVLPAETEDVPVELYRFMRKTGKSPFLKVNKETGEVEIGDIKVWPGTESEGPIFSTKIKPYTREFIPEFSLHPTRPPLAIDPDEYNILMKITRARAVTYGGKWEKVSVSGNVAQRVYDPPRSSLIERATLKPREIGSLKVRPILTAIPDVDVSIAAIEGALASLTRRKPGGKSPRPQIPEADYINDLHRSNPQLILPQASIREESTFLPYWQLDEDIIKLKQSVMHQVKEATKAKSVEVESVEPIEVSFIPTTQRVVPIESEIPSIKQAPVAEPVGVHSINIHPIPEPPIVRVRKAGPFRPFFPAIPGATPLEAGLLAAWERNIKWGSPEAVENALFGQSKNGKKTRSKRRKSSKTRKKVRKKSKKKRRRK